MKFLFITLFLFIGSCTSLQAQANVIDSLSGKLSNAAKDTNLVLLLTELAANYQFYNSDSALLLTNKAISLAKEIHFKRGEIKALSRQGEVWHLSGELPQAFASELEAIRQSREYVFPEAEAESLTFLSTVYIDLGEYRKALVNLFLAKSIYDKIYSQLKGQAKQFPPFVLGNISTVYGELGNADSSLYFSLLAAGYTDQDSYTRADILIRIAFAQRLKKNYDAATGMCWQSLSVTDMSKDLLNQSQARMLLARIYDERQNRDSAKYYANLAFASSQKVSYAVVLADAGQLLTTLYKTEGSIDSAFYFQQAANDANKSLFGPAKFRKLQLLALSEQQRVLQVREEQARSASRIQLLILFASIAIVLFIALILWKSYKVQKEANISLNEKNIEIQHHSESLRQTLNQLKSTQAQLIHAEKMASLGELTAGIAHEIQNPLNFVNNFSDLNKELVDELKEELATGNLELATEIADDIKTNEEKINHHGKRAQSIVTGMLQHSRSGKGEKQLTNVNKLVDEYTRLTYHGMKSKDPHFEWAVETSYDDSIGEIIMIPQEIGKVIVNLVNNALYATAEKSKSGLEKYIPLVTVSTHLLKPPAVQYPVLTITVSDNGNGIPDKIKDKIFNPFFTTKPTGQGTGLGLSLSYDIVKAHGGELKVENNECGGARFIIKIPA